MYEEEEEGYVSGDYEDMPFELVKIRVKVCSLFVYFSIYSPIMLRSCTIGMTSADGPHTRNAVRGVSRTWTSKFGKTIDGLGLKFKDEDGTHVSLRDDSDYDLAIETARRVPRQARRQTRNSGVVTSKPGVVSFNLQP